MRRSLNEIEVALRKAAMGAGWPQGLAEEIGRAGMVLCGLGGDGVGAVLAAIDRPQIASLIHSGEVVRGHGFADVIAALDLLGAGLVSAAHFPKDDPALLQAFALVAGQAQGQGFEVVLADGESLLRSGMFNEPELSSGAEIAEDDWQIVVALLQKTFVPASTGSRLKGAGAGMTDND